MHYPNYEDNRLTKDGEGYICWRGIHVEHYSHDDPKKEIADAKSLAVRCVHLEALGVPVNCGSAVWYWGWFEGLTQRQLFELPDLVKHLLLLHRDLYEDTTGRFCWLDGTAMLPEQPNGSNALKGWYCLGEFRVFDQHAQPPAQKQSLMALMSDDMGCYYHPLVAAGWQIAQMGQNKDNGCCYATTEQLLNWFRKMGAMEG